MERDSTIRPIVKWPGGKRQLLGKIKHFLPESFNTYYELFLGGGALFFYLQPQKAVLNDINQELINLYYVIRSQPDELIKSLKKHKNEKEYYYQIRALDRDRERFANLSPIDKASRILYLNKTSYNGLYRVNKRGEFNAPFGSYKKPNIINESQIYSLSRYLNLSDVSFFSCDYEKVLNQAQEGDFVYLDPPYDPLSDTASFTSYHSCGFDQAEQVRLKEACDRLNKRGVKFILSNSATVFIKELYREYMIHIISAKRNINCNANKRGEIAEIVVKNY